MGAKQYRNKTTGKINSLDEYWEIQIERYFNEANDEEKDDLSQTYGTKAIKVWIRLNPDENFEEYDGAAEVRPNLPPKREKAVESIPVPVSTPPKRNAGIKTGPDSRTEGMSPPKRQASTTVQAALPVTAPPKRAPIPVAAPPKRAPIPVAAPPKRAPVQKSEEEKKKETRENLWRMAKDDPYYDETPTEDDGVYGNNRKIEKNKMILAGALLIIILAGITAIVYVVITM